MKKTHRLVLAAVVLAALVVPDLAEAARSGGSFSGRGGFRSGGGVPRRYSSTPRSSGGGTGFVFLPSFGWGWGGHGVGGGGMLSSLVLLGIVGLGTVIAVRAIRRAAGRGSSGLLGGEHDSDSELGRAYVSRIQLGLGRSGRGIQERLADFASHGDTSSEAGLAELLHQTVLELSREKDSIRYVLAGASGPMSLTNGEAKLNAAAMAERSRFQVERVRSADGTVRRSDAAASEGREVLEYLVVTVLVATRVPMPAVKQPTSREELDSLLAEIGAVPPHSLLGIEVVWTPADPEDCLTQTDLMTTYPELRSL